MFWMMAIVFYYLLMAIVSVYGAHRLWLLAKCTGAVEYPPEPTEQRLPQVTVQLPLYNESRVVRRLLRAVGDLDYPADRLEVQVLDDSTDHTSALVRSELAVLRTSGLRVRHLQREGRDGFKAGALKAGLGVATGEVIAIFDADFIPPADFLRRVLVHLAPGVGMVQARWGFLDARRSLFTRAQATLLHGHFTVEQMARYRSGRWFNFNGTAGIWRREAILDAGGWQCDTLTEDLDLSYRAQLAGWRFVYLRDVVVPSELPRGREAFLGQQFRWAQGGMQTARKLLGPIWRASVGLDKKLEATVHLTGNLGYPVLLLMSLLLPVVIWARWILGFQVQLAMLDVLVFLGAVLPFWLYYGEGLRAAGELRSWTDLLLAPIALALGVGLSWSQTRAVTRGMRGRTGTFVRTPKSGRSGVERLSGGVRGAEGLLFMWVGLAFISAVVTGQWFSLPFIGIFVLGYGWVSFGEPLSRWFDEILSPRLKSMGIRTTSSAGSQEAKASQLGSVQAPVRGSK
jgi:cellulose synthase/poly-beta-1,6-N-acetylglucosamine synthase-like glycosyltransferase